MPVNVEKYSGIVAELSAKNVTLVAVSKTKPAEDILHLYNLGQRDFGENYVQELVDKYHQLPKDIRWHFIGHLQSNKVKLIAPFVSLIHSVDSEKLLHEINKQAKNNERTIDCLLQVFIADEETKFGLDPAEAVELITRVSQENTFRHISLKGLMGMASFTKNEHKIRQEFRVLKSLFDKYSKLNATIADLSVLSMGMSGDYEVAIEEGSNLVRIGSLLFGERIKK